MSENKKTIEELAAECTHNCMTCPQGHCNENGESKLEETLYAIADMEAQDILDILNK